MKLFLKSMCVFFILLTVSCVRQEMDESRVIIPPLPIGDKIPLKIVYYDTDKGENTVWIQKAAELFEESHPTIKIILSPLYGSDIDYANKLSLLLNSDSSVDVVMFDGALFRSFVASGFLVGFMADTWDEWITQFPGNTKKIVMWNGLEYAMPFSLETCGLFYNTAVFNEAGLQTPWHPENWNDILETVQILKGTVPYPFWANTSEALGESTSLQTMLTLISGTYDWIYEDDKWVISSRGLEDSVQFLFDIFQNQKIIDSVNLAIMQGRHTTDTIARKLLAGEIGVVFFSNRLVSALATNGYDSFVNKIGIAPFPRQHGAGGTSVTRTWMFGISSFSSQKFVSFEFLKSLLSKEIQVLSAECRGDFPVRRDATDNIVENQINNYVEEMSDYLYFSRFIPTGTEYPYVSKQLSLLCESVVNGAKNTEQALNDFKNQLEKIIPSDSRLYK